MASVKSAEDPVLVTPPAKKFKQGTLPFKVLDPKKVPSPPQLTPNSKKRKLSAENGLPHPQKKTPRHSLDAMPRPLIVEEKENEVTSTSEPAGCRKLSSIQRGTPPARPVGLMDKYVRTTQQQEISTSSTEDVICLDDDSSSNEGVSSMHHETCSDNASCNEVLITHTQAASSSQGQADAHTTEERECKLVDVAEETPVSTSPDAAAAPVSTTEPSPEKADVATPPNTPTGEDRSKKTDAESPVLADVSPSGSPSGAASASESPTSDTKKTKVSSAKKLQRETEKQKKKEEKEREKMEKLKQKEAARLEKQRQKQEEKAKKEKEREELRRQKEQEKKEKQEAKEKEKEEKQRIKEEERKKKQELMDAKNEEKQRKEEEKKRKEEEKKKEEEEKNKKIEKSKAILNSFIIKRPRPESPMVKDEGCEGTFMPFQVKKHMRLAPVCRVSEEERNNMKSSLDATIPSQDTVKDSLYVASLRRGDLIAKSSGRTWNWQEEVQQDVEIVEKPEKKGSRMKVKLLQFRENYRPAYYGTWRKKSRFINPCRPFAKDEGVFDYDVESDEEWEEEEPGESLSNSEGEDEGNEDGDDDEDDDGFFVPHGYLSDDEGAEKDDEEDEVMSPDRLKAKQLAQAKAWEEELARKVTILKSIVIGCCWLDRHKPVTPEMELLQQFKMVPLINALPIDLTVPVRGDKKADKHANKKDSDSRGAMKRPVPEEAMPDLLRLVHGNSSGIKTLVREFRAFWMKKMGDDSKAEEDGGLNNSKLEDEDDADESGKTPSNFISKRQLEITIRAVAGYKKTETGKRTCWYVKEEILKKYDQIDLPVPTAWEYVTKVKKIVKPKPEVPKPEEKKVQSNPSIAQFAVPMTAEMIQNLASPKPATPSTVHASPGSVNSPNLSLSKLLSTPETPKSSRVPGASPHGVSTPVTPKNGPIPMDCSSEGTPPSINRKTPGRSSLHKWLSSTPKGSQDTPAQASPSIKDSQNTNSGAKNNQVSKPVINLTETAAGPSPAGNKVLNPVFVKPIGITPSTSSSAAGPPGSLSVKSSQDSQIVLKALLQQNNLQKPAKQQKSADGEKKDQPDVIVLD